jgi:cytochrome P450
VRGLVDAGQLSLRQVLELGGRGRLPAMRALWARHGDLFSLRIRGRELVHPIHPDDVQALLVHGHARLAKGGTSYRTIRMVLGDGLITSNGESWERQRRLVAPMLSARTCAELVPTFVATAGRILDSLGAGPHDLSHLMIELAVRQAVAGIFGAGVTEEELDVIDTAMATFMDVFIRHRVFPVPPWLPVPSNLRLRRHRARLDDVIARLAERGTEGGAGILAHLLRAHREGTLSRGQLRDELATLLLAGYETTANAMTWTVYLLAAHPEVQERVRAELLAVGVPAREDLERLAVTRQVLFEAMRLYPPVPVMLREATGDLELGGRTLPPGTFVVFWTYLTHRHPDFWTDPETFRPERFANGGHPGGHPYAYLPFGAGPRRCAGRDFALFEMTVNLALLLRRHRVELVPGRPVSTVPGLTLRPDRRILARLEPLGAS